MRNTGWGILIAALLWCTPGVALAAWPLSGSSGSTMLGFGATYRAPDGSTSTHRGVDIAGAPAEVVCAPLDGTVTFAGRVPGVGGGTVLAVTLQTSSGDVTLLPLAVRDVTSGQTVKRGEAIGSLAAGGDGSSAGVHLHVGLRRGGMYLDPAAVIGAAPRAAEDADAPTGETVTGEAPAGDSVPGTAESGAGAADSGVTQPRVSAGTQGAQAGRTAANQLVVPHAGSAAVTALGGLPVQGGQELSPGVTLTTHEPVLVADVAAQSMTAASRALAVGGDVARSTSAAIMEAGPGAPFSRIAALVRSGVWVLAITGMALLAALGALWPLWRSAQGIDAGKVSVSVVRDDVAAVASR